MQHPEQCCAIDLQRSCLPKWHPSRARPRTQRCRWRCEYGRCSLKNSCTTMRAASLHFLKINGLLSAMIATSTLTLFSRKVPSRRMYMQPVSNPSLKPFFRVLMPLSLLMVRQAQAKPTRLERLIYVSNFFPPVCLSVSKEQYAMHLADI